MSHMCRETAQREEMQCRNQGQGINMQGWAEPGLLTMVCRRGHRYLFVHGRRRHQLIRLYKRMSFVRGYERGNSESSSHFSAIASGVAISAPKSTSGPTCQCIVEKCPSLARKIIPETVQELDARKATPGATCSGRSSPGVTLPVNTRVAATGEIMLTRMFAPALLAVSAFINPSWADLPIA